MKELFGDFFEGKKVLVTGHTGFIGSWLSIWLNELGANVIGYSLPPYTNQDNFVVTNLKERLNHIIGDIRDFEKLRSVFKKFKPNIVFHLAAQPIVRRSYTIPKETYDINVGGTVNVFEAFRQESTCRVLINITTDKCYENKESIEGYYEDDRLGGYDPYSSSKSCSELVTSAYRSSFFKENTQLNPKIVSSVRSGNIIGGGDWQEDRLIPDCIRAITNNQEIIIRNPKSIRPWLFVLEPLRGYLMLASKMWECNTKFAGAWNFGPGHKYKYSVEDIVKKIIQQIGKGNYIIQPSEKSDKFHETEVLVLDCTKSNKHLQWYNVLNLDETIEFLCDWYFKSDFSYDFDISQINRYNQKVIQKKSKV